MNYEQFRFFYDIPTHKCVVIKNGIPKLKIKETFYKEGDPIKLIFHPTPWRGLNVMLAAMQYIKEPARAEKTIIMMGKIIFA